MLIWMLREEEMTDWHNANEELPPENRDVLCFVGSRMFGSYVIGDLHEDSDGVCEWYIDGKSIDDAGVGSVIAWHHIPEFDFETL